MKTLILAVATAMLLSSPLSAASVRPLSLADMCRLADRIVSGTVVHATPGTVAVGGGELPVVTYRLRVDESFKGEVEEVKGLRFTDVRILAARSAGAEGSPRLTASFPGMPELAVGQRYLLLTAGPNSIGMSPLVGRRQGLFHIRGERGREEAVNSYDNRTLFPGGEGRVGSPLSLAGGGLRARGPVSYSHLAREIRRLVRDEGRGR